MYILAKGSSMLPALNDGQVYEIEFTQDKHICVGDIIVFYVDDKLIYHRVVDIYSTKSKRIGLII